MSDIVIKSDRFFDHYEKMISKWDNFPEFNAVVLINGKDEDGVSQSQTQASQYWLFGYEMTDLLLVLTKVSIYIIAGAQKIKMLESFKENKKYKVTLITKDNTNNKDHLNAIFASLQKQVNGKSDVTFATIAKEKQSGGIATEFQNFVQEKNLKVGDMTPLLSESLSVKIGEEIDYIKKAGECLCYLQKQLISDIEKIIQDQKKVSHKDISQQLQSILQDGKKISEIEKQIKIDSGLLEFTYPPIVQSGGVYDLRPQAESTGEQLQYDVIILSTGAAYSSYNTNIVRTLFIEPTPEQQECYNKANEVLNFLITQLQPEKSIKSVYQAATALFTGDLQDQIPVNFGTGIGLEFREMNLIINGKNQKTIEEGMVFNLTVAIEGLTSGKDQKNYAIMIADTVIVKKSGNPNEVITGKISRKYQDVSYELDDDQADSDQGDIMKDTNPQDNNGYVIQTRTRRAAAGGRSTADQNDKKRKLHQEQLKKLKMKELQDRLNNDGFLSSKQAAKTIEIEKCISYTKSSDLPSDLKKNQIYVDTQRESILLPINGAHVPFHINTVKNVSKQEEGKTDSIRINFHTAGAASAQQNITFPTYQKETVFIQEIQYRSQNKKNIEENYKKIKDLSKQVRQTYQDQNNKEEMEEQEKIVLNKGKKPVLKDLQVRPVLSAKKTSGSLECHTNGFRYITSKQEIVDVIFKNIKHAFFQPCDGEFLIAIHFHLHNPITINKKKTIDVQFYTESGLPAEDLNHRRRAGDMDDSEQEQMEKLQRQKLIKEFQGWIKAVQQITEDQINFETPYKELGFYGSPHRSNCLLQPTVNCLINIIENPFFVITLKEVEISCFQRMCAGLKNFDLVFIYKDYHQPVTRITAIPKQHLESIKNWLDKMDIIFFESTRNFAWGNILSTINKGVSDFVEDGGWNIILGDDDEDDEDPDIPEGDESFTIQEDEVDSVESDDDSDDDFDDDDDDSDDYEGGDDDDDEAMDWDNLDSEENEESDSDDKRQKQKSSSNQKQK